jgi:hypothetical protein
MGSLLGAALGLWLGWWSAVLYVDNFPSDEPYASIGVLIIFTPVGGLVGAVLVTWIALRVIHAPRAGVSGLVCGLLLAVLAPVTAGVGAMMIPFDIGNGFPSALLVGTIASFVCAVLTYIFVTSHGKAKILRQPA